MGATAFRPRRSSRGQYKARKERRQRDRWVPTGRGHESPPWYCFPLSAAAYEAKIVRERFEAEQAARLAREEARRLADEGKARAERIAAKRAAQKFAPLTKLAGEVAA